jgi:glycosyltransferase involved in cell wall biosynthesis
VYAQTSVILAPSRYESWGRVPLEAAVSGIPTIAHPTRGLRESLGTAALFADRDSPDEWERSVRLLEDQRVFSSVSETARRRALALEARAVADFYELEERVKCV